MPAQLRHGRCFAPMNQLNLFADQEPQPGGYGLFLAVFPNEFARHDIYGLGIELHNKHKLIGKMRPLDHLHISLPCLINMSVGLDRVIQLVDRACQAIATATSPFAVTFDRVLSFGGPSMKQALVLAGSKDGNAELKAFHRLLAAKLSNGRNANPKFTPHITLLYDRRIDEQSVDPVSWNIKEIVLVRSHVGETKYDHLERWPLGN